MTGLGTILNAVGILLGGLAGLTIAKQLSPRRQLLIKSLLGIFTVYVGLKMAWSHYRSRSERREDIRAALSAYGRW